MSFFNKKEDVMKIELTPHGRKLLSEGKLKPAFYSFFDDDIIYDSERAEFMESNSQTKSRILVDTPSVKPQTNYKGVESQYYNSISPETENVLINAIGTSTLSALKAPAWQVTMIHGEISSSLNHISSSTSPIINVPQIECELNYTASVKGGNYLDDLIFSTGILQTNSSFIATDDSYVELTKPDFIAQVLEKNGFDYKDSLDMEVYIYEEDEQDMTQLNFLKKEQEVKNDLLLDGKQRTQVDMEINETHVEYYFDTFFDKQISDFDLCRGIKKLKDKDIYLGLDINCDKFNDLEVNIYQTEPDIEVCEE